MNGTMSGAKACIAIAAITALIAFGVDSAAGSNRDSGRERGGHVNRCSLDGVNPVYHPDIFGNPAVARSFGFVLGPDHAWHVVANCSPYPRY
jgi:hypothetical protein